MRYVLPARGEFGLRVCYHAPAVHALPRPKVVYHETGEEALYPSAGELREVPRVEDRTRAGTHARGDSLPGEIAALVRSRHPDAEIVRTDDSMPRERFTPEPYAEVLNVRGTNKFVEVGSHFTPLRCDVVVCPRRRSYGSAKNWDPWPWVTSRLRARGLRTFAGGAPDSSYDVPGPKAWDYTRYLDATIAAMLKARLVLSTDAGLAHLAVLCGRPLLLITHGEGLVAPGPSRDEDGRVMDDEYWPVKMHRYREANHKDAPIAVLEHAWRDPEMVVEETLRRVG